MPERNAQPKPAEIKQQLSHMLSSKRFRNAKRQAEFLKLVVERKLEGKKTPGVVVAKSLFADTFKKDESSDVRVTARSLRLSLTAYFEMEGAEDALRIWLPAPPKERSPKPSRGEAYTPIFDYRPFHQLHLQYKAGLVLVEAGTVDSVRQAIRIFGKVLDELPEHAGAAIGMAEAWCRMIGWGKNSIERADLEETSFEALKLLLGAKERNPKDWKVHAVLGCLCLAMAVEKEGFQRANEAFNEALKIDRRRTEDYPPYLLFLVRSGEAEKGLKLADRFIEAHIGDMQAYIAYSDILLATGKIDEASKILKLALYISGPNGLIHQRLYWIRLLQRRFEEATGHFDWMARLLDSFACEAAVDATRHFLESLPKHERDALQKAAEKQERQNQAISRALESLKE